MKTMQKNITDNIKMLMVMNIDIEDNKSVEKLKKILKKLTNSDKFYFQFRREDTDFLTDEEIMKYRCKIPRYFRQNGKYEVKIKLDEERFCSIGYLPIKEELYERIIIFWKYFYGMMFFNPNCILTWHDYEKSFGKIKSEEYGINIIQNKYADSVFLKGHDGDNLIFVYGSDYDESLVTQVIQIIESF